MRIIGLDPGLQHTGWGVIESIGNRLVHVANGRVSTKAAQPTAARLNTIYEGLMLVMKEFSPEQAAVEETFVNQNPASALKLGFARGVVLLAPARAGLVVAEYAPRLVKKSLVGTGAADKDQIRMMINVLMPGSNAESEDAADALAVAVCHAHHAGHAQRIDTFVT